MYFTVYKNNALVYKSKNEDFAFDSFEYEKQNASVGDIIEITKTFETTLDEYTKLPDEDNSIMAGIR